MYVYIYIYIYICYLASTADNLRCCAFRPYPNTSGFNSIVAGAFLPGGCSSDEPASCDPCALAHAPAPASVVSSRYLSLSLRASCRRRAASCSHHASSPRASATGACCCASSAFSPESPSPAPGASIGRDSIRSMGIDTLVRLKLVPRSTSCRWAWGDIDGQGPELGVWLEEASGSTGVWTKTAERGTNFSPNTGPAASSQAPSSCVPAAHITAEWSRVCAPATSASGSEQLFWAKSACLRV